MKKIKLIWDFRGPNGRKTSIHHEKHIREFFRLEKMCLIESGTESLNDFHYFAYAIILGKDLEKIKSILKPNRGKLVE